MVYSHTVDFLDNRFGLTTGDGDSYGEGATRAAFTGHGTSHYVLYEKGFPKGLIPVSEEEAVAWVAYGTLPTYL